MEAAQETVETVETYVNLIKSTEIKKLVFVVLGMVLGFILVRLILRLLKKILKKSRHLPESTHTILCTLLRILLDLIVIITAAGYLGIPMTSFVALLSVIGIAVSLAVQGLLTNLVGGFIILGSKPFEVGHFIEACSLSGTVKQIGIIYTRLQAPDGRIIFIPNGTLYTSQVINYTALGTRRVTLTPSASYDNSPDEVRAAILLAVSRVPGIFQDPAPVIQLEAYGDSSISYNVHVWCGGSDFIRVKYELNEALYQAFKDSGVIMTYPHLNVHMNN